MRYWAAAVGQLAAFLPSLSPASKKLTNEFRYKPKSVLFSFLFPKGSAEFTLANWPAILSLWPSPNQRTILRSLSIVLTAVRAKIISFTFHFYRTERCRSLKSAESAAQCRTNFARSSFEQKFFAPAVDCIDKWEVEGSVRQSADTFVNLTAAATFSVAESRHRC